MYLQGTHISTAAVFAAIPANLPGITLAAATGSDVIGLEFHDSVVNHSVVLDLFGGICFI